MELDYQKLSKYPRPSLRRNSFISLNGVWKHIIYKDNEEKKDYSDIIVPFSPEVQNDKHILLPDETLEYVREFNVDKKDLNKVLLLHFIAIDQIAEIYFNDRLITKHIGGFLPIDLEIKEYKEHNTIKVVVKDLTDTSYHSRGKQKLKYGGIWYTPHSGIYMPTWAEFVNNNYIKSVKFTPDVDKSSIKVLVKTDKEEKVSIYFDNKEYQIVTNKEAIIKLDNMKLWSIDSPYLYDTKIKTNSDEVDTYFAMRKVSTYVDKDGHKRVAINNRPLFISGVLDQGYYKEGLLTPPSFDSYEEDIKLLKSLGFNMLRKHIKIEPDYFYYLCDKLGMLVIQDFVNGGTKYKFSTIAFPLVTDHHKNDHNYKKFGRADNEGRDEFISEAKTTIDLLYNHPSIFAYTIFNEGWGQFDAKEVHKCLKDIDNTRLYDATSGWHDQYVGDFKSQHVYFKKYKLPKEKSIKNRVIFLSEFGGYSLNLNEDNSYKKFGYKSISSKEQLTSEIVKLYDEQIIPNIEKGLSMTVYTQLSDVEGEINGFVTFDRSKIKVDISKIKELNDRLYLTFDKYINYK